FDTFYGREPTLDGLQRMKPEPYYIEKALEDLGTRNAVYVGDRESDVLAANAAGIDSVFVHRPHTDGYPDVTSAPTYEIESLHELDRVL
ncbi:MAG: HAD-IA family hydrolase, partial [Halobacteria archaeon]|nr:HAD-IA family hydrolase [Halobacteria archaeon]